MMLFEENRAVYVKAQMATHTLTLKQKQIKFYPLRGILACDWTPVEVWKLELLARVTNGVC